MDIEVVMPVLNSSRSIGQSIRSIREHLNPKGIVVVDGGSSDGTPTIAKELGCTVLTDSSGLGSSRMTGIKACTSELICFIDDDIYVTEGFRDRLVGFLDDKTGAVQGVALPLDPRLRERGKQNFEKRLAGRDNVSLRRLERGYTNATLVRRELLLDLDISDMNAYEDLVIARHVIDKGFLWKVVPVYVDHDHRGKPTLMRSAWNYAGVWNLARTGRIGIKEGLVMFARFAYSHPVEMADALRSSDKERFLTQLRLLVGAMISPAYLVWSWKKRH